jgi:hypothetical protein
MKDQQETLPERLAQLVREEEHALAALDLELGQEFAQLAHGRLAGDRLRGLEREAASDPQKAEALALHEPLPAALQASLVASARAGLASSRSSRTHLVAPSSDDLARQRLLRQRLGFASVSLAVAAGALLFLRGGPPAELAGLPTTPVTDSAPPQVMEPAPPEASEPASPISNSSVMPTKPAPLAQRVIDFALLPDGELGGAVQVSAAVKLPDGSVRPLRLPFRVSPTGEVRLAGRTALLFPGLHGPITLLVLVSKPGAQRPTLTSADGPDAGPGWRRVRRPLQLGPDQN